MDIVAPLSSARYISLLSRCSSRLTYFTPDPSPVHVIPWSPTMTTFTYWILQNFWLQTHVVGALPKMYSCNLPFHPAESLAVGLTAHSTKHPHQSELALILQSSVRTCAQSFQDVLHKPMEVNKVVFLYSYDHNVELSLACHLLIFPPIMRHIYHNEVKVLL